MKKMMESNKNSYFCYECQRFTWHWPVAEIKIEKCSGIKPLVSKLKQLACEECGKVIDEASYSVPITTTTTTNVMGVGGYYEKCPGCKGPLTQRIIQTTGGPRPEWVCISPSRTGCLS